MRFAAVAIALIVAFATPWVIQLGAAQSFQTRPDFHLADYAKGWIWAAVLSASILVWPIRPSMKLPILWAWLFRVSVALVGSIFYFNHYGSLDAYGYFAARNTTLVLSDIGVFSGTQVIIGFVALLRRIVPDSFHAMNLTFAMIGMAGVYLFWRASEAFLGYSSLAIFYLLMMEPSLTFWTAGLGKDAVMVFAAGLYTYGVVAWWRTRIGSYLLLALTGVTMATVIRPWMGVILLGPAIILIYGLQRHLFSRLITTAVVVATVIEALPFLLSAFYLEAARDITEQVATLSSRFNAGGSAGLLVVLPGPGDIIRYAPFGIFTALFRPLPGEIMNPFGLMAGIENLFLLGLLARVLHRIRWTDFKDPLIGWAIGIVLCWGFTYAFISSQNFGSGVRYRTEIFPIFLGLLLYLGRANSIHLSGPR